MASECCYGLVAWRVEDLDGIVPDEWTTERRHQFLSDNSKYLRDCMVEYGFEALKTYVEMEVEDE